jgi:hypothetical protein
MASQEEVSNFLNGFKAKMGVFSLMFRDERRKNTQALLDMEITPVKRKEIIESIVVEDYSEGPLDDKLYGVSGMWVFGKYIKELEIYIKISVGVTNSPVLCISFHPAEHKMNYPFKKHIK